MLTWPTSMYQTPNAMTGGTRLGTRLIRPRRRLRNAASNDSEIRTSASVVPTSMPSILRSEMNENMTNEPVASALAELGMLVLSQD